MPARSHTVTISEISAILRDASEAIEAFYKEQYGQLTDDHARQERRRATAITTPMDVLRATLETDHAARSLDIPHGLMESQLLQSAALDDLATVVAAWARRHPAVVKTVAR